MQQRVCQSFPELERVVQIDQEFHRRTELPSVEFGTEIRQVDLEARLVNHVLLAEQQPVAPGAGQRHQVAGTMIENQAVRLARHQNLIETFAVPMEFAQREAVA